MSKILSIAINSSPVLDDPFMLQLVLSVSNRQLLLCEKTGEDMLIRRKISLESNVETLAYNRNCICFAMANSYYIFNITNNTMQSLFPYDLQTIRPLVITIDTVCHF